jgi:UDP-glucose 4-epimerase
VTLLLTGATGLVGSRLLPRLVEDGFECRALVRGDAALPSGTCGCRQPCHGR